jgi:hypothetical protein
MIKNTKGISMILVGVVIAVLAVGGVIIYKAGQNSSQVVYDENWPPQDLSTDGDLGLSFLEGENNSNQVLDSYDPLVEEEECLVVTNISAGDTVSFPLDITGTIGYRCWGIFEGEAGFVHIEQNGQIISQGQPTDRLIRMTSGYYMESDYPVSFSANIPSISGGVAGPANLVITERGDLGEDGNSYVPEVVIIPINLGSNMGSLAQNSYSFDGKSFNYPADWEVVENIYTTPAGASGVVSVTLKPINQQNQNDYISYGGRQTSCDNLMAMVGTTRLYCFDNPGFYIIPSGQNPQPGHGVPMITLSSNPEVISVFEQIVQAN